MKNNEMIKGKFTLSQGLREFTPKLEAKGIKPMSKEMGFLIGLLTAMVNNEGLTEAIEFINSQDNLEKTVSDYISKFLEYETTEIETKVNLENYYFKKP